MAVSHSLLNSLPHTSLDVYKQEFDDLKLNQQDHPLYLAEKNEQPAKSFNRISKAIECARVDDFLFAFYNLANAYVTNEEYSKAYLWFSRVIDVGNSRKDVRPMLIHSKYHMANHLAKGMGCEKNLKRAVLLYKESWNAYFKVSGKINCTDCTDVEKALKTIIALPFTNPNEFVAILDACKFLYDIYCSHSDDIKKKEMIKLVHGHLRNFNKLSIDRSAYLSIDDLSLLSFYHSQNVVVDSSVRNLKIGQAFFEKETKQVNLDTLAVQYPFKILPPNALRDDHFAAVYQQAVSLEASKPKEACCFYLKLWILTLQPELSTPKIPPHLIMALRERAQSFFSRIEKNSKREEVSVAKWALQMSSSILLDELMKNRGTSIHSDKVVYMLTLSKLGAPSKLWNDYRKRVDRKYIAADYSESECLTNLATPMHNMERRIARCITEDAKAEEKSDSREMLLAVPQLLRFKEAGIGSSYDINNSREIVVIYSYWMFLLKLIANIDIHERLRQVNLWTEWFFKGYYNKSNLKSTFKEAMDFLYVPKGGGVVQPRLAYEGLHCLISQVKNEGSNLDPSWTYIFDVFAATVCGTMPDATTDEVDKAIQACERFFLYMEKNAFYWPILICMKNLEKHIERLKDDSLCAKYVKAFTTFDKENQYAAEIAKYSIIEEKKADAPTPVVPVVNVSTPPMIEEVKLVAQVNPSPAISEAAESVIPVTDGSSSYQPVFPIILQEEVDASSVVPALVIPASLNTTTVAMKSASESFSSYASILPAIDHSVTPVPTAPVMSVTTEPFIPVSNSSSSPVHMYPDVQQLMIDELSVADAMSQVNEVPSILPSNSIRPPEEAPHEPLVSVALSPRVQPSPLAAVDLPIVVALPISAHRVSIYELYQMHELKQSGLNEASKELVYLQLLYHVIVHRSVDAYDFLMKIVYNKNDINLLMFFSIEMLALVSQKPMLTMTPGLFTSSSADPVALMKYYSAQNNIMALHSVATGDSKEEMRTLAYHHLIDHALAKHNLQACQCLIDIAGKQNKSELVMFFTQIATGLLRGQLLESPPDVGRIKRFSS